MNSSTILRICVHLRPIRFSFMFFDFLAPLLIGFVGSLHCLGMCGPLVMAYSLHIRKEEKGGDLPPSAFWVRGLTHHAAFHAGRILTYGLLGALAAVRAPRRREKILPGHEEGPKEGRENKEEGITRRRMRPKRTMRMPPARVMVLRRPEKS